MRFTLGFLPFEQERRDAEQAKRDRIAAELANRKATKLAESQARNDAAAKLKSERRWKRERKATEKNKGKGLWAACGINLYSYDRLRSCCLKCKQPLIYEPMDQALNAKRECPGRPVSQPSQK